MTPRLFDFSDWSVIEMTGADRQSFLHSFSTNDIKRLEPGQGCEAFVPSIKGRILGHVLVYAGSEALQLLAVPGSNETLTPHLTKYLLGVDAQVVDRSQDFGALCISDTNLAGWMQSQLGVGLPSEMHEHFEIEVGGAFVCVARSCLTSHDNVLISGTLEGLNTARDWLLEHGCEVGTLDEFHAERIAAGFPWHGVDISEATIAQEAARTEQAISFTKGCYLGQEPIARLDAMGHTNKEIRGLQITAADLPNIGDELFSNEKVAGSITSIAKTGENTAVALAMIKTKYGAVGNSLSLAPESEDQQAKIVWPE